MKHTLRSLMLMASVAATGSAHADAIAYGEVVRLQAQGTGFKVQHHHDWSKTGNRAASVTWIASDGKVERKLASPALTWLGVSKDSRYVIGLSKVLLDNLNQFAVWTREGHLVAQRRIAAQVACLTPTRYRELRRKHAKGFEALSDRVWSGGTVVYVDFMSMGMPDRLGPLWGELLGQGCASPYSPNFSQSVTNWIFWFDEANPAPEVIEVGGKPFGLRLRDPKGVAFTIPFQLDPPRDK